MSRRLLTTPRLVLCLVGLVAFNSVLESVPLLGRRLQIATNDNNNKADNLPATLGNHYVTIYVGNPAQPQRLMVSLASEFTSFPCTGCTNCGNDHTSPPFDFHVSSLVHQCPNDCMFAKSRCEDGTDKCIIVSSQTSDEDTEGGFRGFETRDTTYLDTNTGELPTHREGFIMDFVCQTTIRGMTQDKKSDGLLSLSMAPTSFISQLFARGKIANRKFALCFNHINHQSTTTTTTTTAQEDGSSIGSVHFGEFDRSKHTSTLMWALNAGQSTYGPGNYAVHIKNIHLGIGGGGTPLKSASQGTMSIIPIGKNIGDSFTPPEEWLRAATIQTNKVMTQLPANYEVAFRTAFEQLVGAAYDNVHGMTMSEDDLSFMPTLFLQLEPHNRAQGGVNFEIPGFAGHVDPDNHYDVLLAIPAEHYFVYNPDTGIAIPTVHFSDKISFLGSAVLQGHDVAFDLDHNRIGFAEVENCGDSLSLVSPPTSAPTNEDRKGGRIIGNRTTDGDDDEGTGVVNGTNATVVPAVVVVGGGGSEDDEQVTGIPRANGRGNFHVGPGAIKATERLKEMNPDTIMDLDFYHLGGLMALLLSFGVVVYATRDKTNDRKDITFKDIEGPIYYTQTDEEKRKAWRTMHPPAPPPPQQPQSTYQPPTPPPQEQEMNELEDTIDESMNSGRDQPFEKQSSFRSAQPSQAPEEQPRRSIGLQMWSSSTKELFEKKEKGPLYGPGRRDSDYTEGTYENNDDAASRVSEEQSQYSQESDASYFVKKPPQAEPTQFEPLLSHHLPTVEEVSEASESRYDEQQPVVRQPVARFGYGLPPRASSESTFDQPDVSISQRTPGGVSYVDSMMYSESESDNEMAKQPSKTLGDDYTAASGDYTATSEDFTPETSSLPGMGASSSIPGMGAYEKAEQFDNEVMYPVDEEEEEEEQDHFPGPEEQPFIPGHSQTGFLTARREDDDDQSLLTMEEFPDGGSVATKDRSMRGTSTDSPSVAATQVSDGTTQRSNKGGSRRWGQ